MIPLIDAGMRILDKVIPDPEQRAKLKADLIQLEQKGELTKIEYEVADRASARDLAKSQGTKIQGVLSFLIVFGFFGTLAWAISGRIPATVDNMYVGALLGTLGTMTVQVINFWFGSSNGSSVKNSLLAAQQKNERKD